MCALRASSSHAIAPRSTPAQSFVIIAKPRQHYGFTSDTLSMGRRHPHISFEHPRKDSSCGFTFPCMNTSIHGSKTRILFHNPIHGFNQNVSQVVELSVLTSADSISF